MPKFLVAGLVAGLAVILGGCGPAEEPGLTDLSGRDTIEVVATTGMIADAVATVGAGRVEVEGLMGPGVDPHLYKASEGDVRLLEAADLVFYNGLHLEAKMADVLARVPGTRAVAEAIPTQLLDDVGDDQHDPHVWFDVGLWQLVVADVRDGLVAADAAHADLYRRNARAYLQELAALDAYVGTRAARVPATQRVLITAHDAFAYFGAAYGFQVRGLQGISTVSEAGARDVSELAAFIADRRIPAIFVESSVSPRTIEAVQAAVRARGFDVAIGGSLYSDAMGSAGTPDGTYVGMVRHNVDTIVEALLGGGAP
jgi:manganese/zinc/iron transport system substrate-binding protein